MVCRFSFSAVFIALFAGCFWGNPVNDKEVGLGEDDGGLSSSSDVAILPPEITFPCVDDFDGVYAAQAANEDALGAVIACQVDHEADSSEVAARLTDADVSGVEVKAGYRSYRIAYRTNRDTQTTGTGTGRLYLPDLPGPRPVVVVAHGTAGLADRCAPSRYAPAVSSDALAMPWVASGFVTVLPDYAGLGNPGVQGYGNRADTTFSIVDAARAAAAVLNTLPEFIVVGHSQGGAASLSTQALAGNYGSPDVELIAAISIAGNLKEDKTLNAFRFPSIPIRGGGGVTLVVTLFSLYADWANLAGEAQGGEIFHPDIRNHVVASIENECVFETVASVNTVSDEYEVPGTVGTIVDPTLREAIVSCDRDDNCTSETSAYVARRRANVSIPNANGAPVLMLSGADDVQSTLQNQACTRDYLQAAGVEPTTCAFTGKDHFTIPEASIAYGLAWVEAILEELPSPSCPDGLAYPQCAD